MVNGVVDVLEEVEHLVEARLDVGRLHDEDAVAAGFLGPLGVLDGVGRRAGGSAADDGAAAGRDLDGQFVDLLPLLGVEDHALAEGALYADTIDALGDEVLHVAGIALIIDLVVLGERGDDRHDVAFDLPHFIFPP